MIDNDSLGAVLERALDDEPPAGGGAEEVFAAATRLRWRRRAWTAAAGVATLGLVAGTVIGIGALTRTSAPAALTPAAPSTPSAPASSAPPLSSMTQPTGMQIVDTLARLIPAGGTVTKHSAVNAINGGSVTYRDGRGRTLVQATFDADIYQLFSGAKNGPGPEEVAKQFSCSAVLSMSSKGTTCTSDTLPGGAKTISVQGPAAGDYPGVSGKLRYVAVLYPTGTMARVSEWNMADPKRGPVTRSKPAFTLAQIYAMATSVEWLKL